MNDGVIILMDGMTPAGRECVDDPHAGMPERNPDFTGMDSGPLRFAEQKGVRYPGKRGAVLSRTEEMAAFLLVTF